MTEVSLPQIGYIGLGAAGAPMAAKLVDAGYSLTVYDRDEDRRRHFGELHPALVADSAVEVAGADIVVTMLPNGSVVRDVLFGADEGLVAQLRAGTIVIDTSSSDPFGTRRLGAELARRGVVLIDAPVTREVPGHEHLRIMVGGDDEPSVDRVMPVLSVLAEKVYRVGALGAGHAAKTLNNFVAASGLVAALDAMVIGHRFGLDPAQLMEVLSAGTGQNFSTRHVLANESLSRNYDSGFQLALLVKDLGIACELVQQMEFPTSLAAYLRERMAAASHDLAEPSADHAKAIVHWERRNGRSLTDEV